MSVVIKRAIITHRKGTENQLANYQYLKKAEVVIVTSSIVNDYQGFNNSSLMFFGSDDGKATAVNRILVRPSAPPTLSNALLNGVPYYDVSNNLLYILNSGSNGHSHIEIKTKIDEGEY